MKNQDKNTLAYVVEKKMIELGLNQTTLANKAGVEQPIISRLINGGKYVGTSNIYEILKALGFLQEENRTSSPLMPQELKEVFPDLEYIYGSKNPGIKQALSSNIREFKESVRKDMIADKYIEKIDNLEEAVKDLQAKLNDSKLEEYATTVEPLPENGTKKEKM